MEATEKLIIVMRIIVIGFVGAVLFHFTMGKLGYDYPLNTFLFLPSNRFMDYNNLYDITKNFNPYFGEKNNLAVYFPITYIVVYPLTWLEPHMSLRLYYAIFCGFLIWFIHYQARTISPNRLSPRAVNLFSLLIFLSFPVIFCLDRGNIDGLIFVIVALSMIAFNNKKYYLSAIPLAIAAGMKIYPLVFIVLFIKEKRWKELFFCLAITALITAAALVSFKMHAMSKNLHKFGLILTEINKICIVGDQNMDFSSSLFSLLKMAIWTLPPINSNYANLHAYTALIPKIQFYYMAFTLCAFSVIAGYIVFIEKTRWKQVMLLTSSMILFPYISADYKLIFLIIPFLFFVITDHKDKLDGLYTALFALLFIPKNYFIFQGPFYYIMPKVSIYSVMDLINVGILMGFVLVIIQRGFSKRSDY